MPGANATGSTVTPATTADPGKTPRTSHRAAAAAAAYDASVRSITLLNTAAAALIANALPVTLAGRTPAEIATVLVSNTDTLASFDTDTFKNKFSEEQQDEIIDSFYNWTQREESILL